MGSGGEFNFGGWGTSASWLEYMEYSEMEHAPTLTEKKTEARATEILVWAGSFRNYFENLVSMRVEP